MLRKLVVCAVIGLISGMIGPAVNSSQAQGWGGGGVRVRAPFVRVDVGPDGGVSVRAPFTAVDVPPRGYYYDPNYPSPYVQRGVVVPSAADLAQMDDEQLNQALLTIAQSLHNRLNRFDTGATWQRYFRLPDEVADISTPADARIAAIATLLDKFHKIAADPQYPMIAGLPQFVAMEAALNEALSRPDNARTPSAAAAEDLPLPPQQRQPPQQQLPPPQRSTDAGRNTPFLQPK